MKKIFYSAALALCSCVMLVFVVVSCKKKKDSDSSSASCTLDCKNGGTCSNNACNCADGWSGATCETYYTASYAGNYSTSAFNCSGTSTPMTMNVALDANDKTKLIFGAFYGTLTDKTHFTIPSQTISGGMTVSGSGTINGTSMTISYTGHISVAGQNITSTCSGSFTKQ